MGDVVKHISKDDLCPFCKKTKATLLCDMPHSTVVHMQDVVDLKAIS